MLAFEPVDLRIEIVNRRTQAIEHTFYPTDVDPGTSQRLLWDGRDLSGRAADGALRFAITGASGEPIAPNAKRSVDTDFRLYGNRFPIRGRHTYGDGLGAGRNHGGQDLPADCGRGPVASRGGRVRAAGYQANGSGYYVVINGRGTQLDYVHMHMLEPASVQEGERVHTGQLTGRVGSTGRSSGCHLHFELWRGTWSAGGQRIDPAAALRRWDRYS